MLPNTTHRRNPLIYTKEGDLDTGQLVLLVCCTVGLGVFLGIALKKMTEPSPFAWSWFGAFCTMCFIAGVNTTKARLIAGSKAMGEVSKGIASASNLPSKTDNESADSTS